MTLVTPLFFLSYKESSECFIEVFKRKMKNSKQYFVVCIYFTDVSLRYFYVTTLTDLFDSLQIDIVPSLLPVLPIRPKFAVKGPPSLFR